jgi:signal peptidase
MRAKINSKMKIVSRVIMGILVLLLIGLAFIFFAPGYDLYLVRSESMTPTINMGDLIITGPAKTIEQGDIITYDLGGELVTHRVYSTDETGIKTKGDAVEDPDSWTVQSTDVVGSFLFKIPYVGFITNFIRSKIGWFVMIIVPAAVLVLWLAKDIVKEALSDA